MTRLRVPIAGLMLFLLPVAVGLAALRDPSELWASALFSLTILALLVSVLGTVARRGASRIAFLGFTLFGTTYLILAFGPWPWINADGLRPPPLLTRILLDKFRESKVGPAANWAEMRIETDWRGYSQQLTFGPADLTIIPPTTGGPVTVAQSMYLVFDASLYKQIAHSMLTLVAGTLGAIAGRIIAPREADSPRP
jgi:hypothetical protein